MSALRPERSRARRAIRRFAGAWSVACLTACGADGTEPRPPVVEPAAGIPAGPYVAGRSYLGRLGYVEYIAGDAPVILTAPHGGALTPSTVPERTTATCGVAPTTGADLNTADLARRMQASWFSRFGTRPHVVINQLHRSRFDANRPVGEAACGNGDAIRAFEDWHAFIGAARATVVRTSGKGWYVDVHGHGHAKQRLELGYLLSADQLRLSDAALDARHGLEDSSSVAAVSRRSPVSFAELLRGATSLGALYAAEGFPATPAPNDPAPLSGDAFFSGGYNTARYGCGTEAPTLGGAVDGAMCGVQIEANFTGVRDTGENRQRFADATAAVLERWLLHHMGLDVRARPARATPGPLW